MPQTEVNNAFDKLLDKTAAFTPSEIKRQAQTESMSSDHRDIDEVSDITAADVAATQEAKVAPKFARLKRTYGGK